jgi:hypothetical protein
MTYTIIATSGDNGEQFAIGNFANVDRARNLADEWMESENPDRDPDGMHYTYARIRPIAEWKAET